MSGTVVIAEIGENHCGDWDRARAMVIAAARCGADIVKFQSYRGMDVRPDDPEREWFSRVELSDTAHRVLQDPHERPAVLTHMASEHQQGPAQTLERGPLPERLGLQLAEEILVAFLEEPLGELLTGAEMIVEETEVDPGTPRHPTHRDGREPSLFEQGAARFQQPQLGVSFRARHNYTLV